MSSAARTGLDARSTGGWGELQIYPSERLSFVAGAGDGDRRLLRAAFIYWSPGQAGESPRCTERGSPKNDTVPP